MVKKLLSFMLLTCLFSTAFGNKPHEVQPVDEMDEMSHDLDMPDRGGRSKCRTLRVRRDLLVGRNVKFFTCQNPLNAIGSSFEVGLGDIRGTIGLSGSVALTAGGSADTAITVSPSVTTSSNAGAGFTASTVVGGGFSSGIILTTTTGGTDAYDLVVALQVPVTFTSPAFLSTPTITLSLNNGTVPVTNSGVTALTDANTATTLQVATSNVTTTSATLNLLFHVQAQGTSYANAVANANTAINAILSSTGIGLAIGFIAQGPVL